MYVFLSRRKLNILKEFKFEYNGYTIKGQNTVNYLGVNLEQTLSGELMAKSIIGKVTTKLNFYTGTNNFSMNLSKQIYVLPYCSGILTIAHHHGISI